MRGRGADMRKGVMPSFARWQVGYDDGSRRMHEEEFSSTDMCKQSGGLQTHHVVYETVIVCRPGHFATHLPLRCYFLSHYLKISYGQVSQFKINMAKIKSQRQLVSMTKDSSPRQPASEPHSSDSDSSDEESDHLDAVSSRKKRKLSVDFSQEEGDDEDDNQDESDDDDDVDEDGGKMKQPVAKPTFAFNAPSRIKRHPAKGDSERIGKGQPVTDAEMEDAVQSVAQAAGKKRILAPTDQNTTFESLGVEPWLVQSLANLAVKRPTGIQKGCIGEILKGRDCIGGSRTGSGKTIAFAVPILQKYAQDPSAIFAVVLTATRELALQIYEQFKAVSSPHVLKAALIIGGSDMRSQAIALAQRPSIVIATPGRLADHIRSSGEDTICGLRRVKFLVLDEADRLLSSKGPGSMLPHIDECMAVLPPPEDRQTLLFTATVTPEVRALKEMPTRPGKEPVHVCEVDTQVLAIPDSLKQSYIQLTVTHREHFLHEFLLTAANTERSIIIFVNRTSTAQFLHHLLRLLDHRVTSLHSKLRQQQRIDNLGRFRASAARILVATDVASRGLDIPEVSVVVNYDLPRDPDDYIHRVGRTARAGRKGEAVNFVGQRDVELVLAIEKRVGRPMEKWEEEGVNLETRVIRDSLKLVSEKKREALLNIEENREVGGRRKRQKLKLGAE
ncbi:putative RNA helicase [Pyricularia oryzae]|nr:putative RNA helicase [Pyricularia oryzae]